MLKKYYINKDNLKVRVLFFFIFFYLLSLLFPLIAYAQVSDNLSQSCQVTDTTKAVRLNLGFSVPGVIYEIPEGSKQYYVKDMGCYIGGFYKYFAGVAGILCAVMIMFGGWRYVTSFGSPQKISAAKETLSSALIGLVILLGSYLILYTINPNLISLRTPALNIIEPIKLEKPNDWEGVSFCREKANFQQILCGGKFTDKIVGEKGNELTYECIMARSNDKCLCTATKYAGTPEVKCLDYYDVNYIKPGEALRRYNKLKPLTDVECGLIKDDCLEAFGSGICVTGSRGIGTKCPNSKEGCVIFYDDGATIYGENDLKRSTDKGIIGSYVNWGCF